MVTKLLLHPKPCVGSLGQCGTLKNHDTGTGHIMLTLFKHRGPVFKMQKF
jgi:hypothetical protein